MLLGVRLVRTTPDPTWIRYESGYPKPEELDKAVSDLSDLDRGDNVKK